MSKNATALNTLLADYQVLYQKLRNYHWNVTGPHFYGLHSLFEELYNGVSDKVDEIAERIRALDEIPASTLRAQLALARLKEDETQPPGLAMVENLRADYTQLNVWLRAAADEADPATRNLLEGFADEQEKTLWMLRAWLAGQAR